MSEPAGQTAVKARALVVEDDKQICELLTDTLRRGAVEPRCVSTDREAYEALASGERFNCMIVDVNLGTGTTGFDVARFACKLHPQLPVVYVSGQTSEASFKAFGVPGSLFLPKPFLPSELLERIRMLVGDNGSE
ncbi:MAG: CheY-like receiver [Caulobacter sp.]|nr:CheY-like receiver [Caulobacter sp.]